MVIYVETNVITRTENFNFNSTLFSPIAFYTKQQFSILRDKNQPGGVLKGILKFLLGKENNITKDVPLNKKSLIYQKLAYSISPNENNLQVGISNLKRQIDVLKEAGVQIIFFEMPVHPDICNKILPQVIRKHLKQKFPKGKYSYIPKSDCSIYQTTDGVHLNSSSATRYSRYLNKEIILFKKLLLE